MATQQEVFQELQNIKNAITQKGGTVTVANTNVSLPELTAGVNSIPSGGNSYKIKTAELPNITIELYGEDDALIESKNTGTNGGAVEFSLNTAGTYTLKAKNSEGTQVWTNTVTISEMSVYNVKTGKALNDYTWAEIKTASEGGYAKYMWSLGDTKHLSAFMGQTSTSYTRATIIGFDHDDLASGSGKAGITFKLPYTNSAYKHHNSGSGAVNGVSWIGSLIRSNCLKSNEDQYVYDTAVTSSTEGTYYTLNDDNETFTQVTLPTDYVEGTKYYAKTTLETDGAFIAGLPTDLSAVIKQVTKLTSGGRGGDKTSSDNTIIKTKDWLFLLADGEVFGNENRYESYSKYNLEGEQYEYYKEYAENKLRSVYSLWLRSPIPSTTNAFAFWHSSGFADFTNAISAFRVALCFCI